MPIVGSVPEYAQLEGIDRLGYVQRQSPESIEGVACGRMFGPLTAGLCQFVLRDCSGFETQTVTPVLLQISLPGILIA